MPEQTPQRYLPQLKGLVEPRVEQEMLRFCNRLYTYYDAKLVELEGRIGKTTTATVRSQLGLFAANLAAPLPEGTGDELDTVGTDKAITVGDVPNLPISKITGILPLAQTSLKVLLSNDGLTTVPGVFAITGKITITDNDGNNIDLLYT